MLLGNKKTQRIIVGVVIGLLVISLALSLVAASASPLSAVAPPRGANPVAVQASDPSPTPAPATPVLDSSGEPIPVTKTPQGTTTQATDGEHVGGLVAYLVFMLGGVLLLVRGRRREAREGAANRVRQPILP
ncbi:MAG: hypothetical protein ABIS35_09265 [Terracoccus sp.]